MDQHHIKGFTLFEVVMVVLIMSVLAVVTFVRWPGYSLNVGAQAQQLASDIRYTQALSMSTGQRYYLQITTGSRLYQIKNEAGTAITLPNGANSVTLGTGISFGTLTNLPSSLIAFDGVGTPYVTTGSPGTALSATATIPLVSSSLTQTVSISAGTGRVIVS